MEKDKFRSEYSGLKFTREGAEYMAAEIGDVEGVPVRAVEDVDDMEGRWRLVTTPKRS